MRRLNTKNSVYKIILYTKLFSFKKHTQLAALLVHMVCSFVTYQGTELGKENL